MKISSTGTVTDFCCAAMQTMAENGEIRWESDKNRAVACLGVEGTDRPSRKVRIRFCPFCGEPIRKRRERKHDEAEA